MFLAYVLLMHRTLWSSAAAPLSRIWLMSLLCAGPPHQAPPHRRRAEPSVVIEELPPDEEVEPPKPKASSKLSAGNGAHQQAVSASNKKATPLRPSSAAATGDPAAAPKPDHVMPASPSPSVAAAAAAAPTTAASNPSSVQPQTATSKQKAVQQLQASTSGSGAAKKQRNGPDQDSQKVLQSKVPDQSSPAGTPSPNSRAATSPYTAAASADTDEALSSGQNLPGAASLSTERSSQLLSAAHQQADLHANGSATAAAPQANGQASDQQQLQQQQQASKAAQEAVTVSQNVKAGDRDRVPAKAHAGNTTGMALAAPRSGKTFAQLGQGRQMAHRPYNLCCAVCAINLHLFS